MDGLLGIDLGSTSIKAVAYDLTGRGLARASRPTPLVHPDPAHPDWAVWDPEAVWRAVAESVREALSRAGGQAAVKGVAVTGMGMDGLPVDAEGRWLYPFISWHCPRTITQQRWWLERIGADRQFGITGTQVWSFNTALRLLWMREHEPAILDRARKWLLIEDFVNFRLCGRMATDYSMASTTLLFDQRQRRWSDELLAASGIDGRLLCEPLPAGTVLGEVHAAAAEATGLAPGTPVVLGGHDYCCGELPTGAFEPGVVLDVLGTWEMVVGALAAPPLTPGARATGVFVDSHVARGMWTYMGAAVAADMLEWFRRVTGAEAAASPEGGDGAAWERLVALAEAAPPGADGVLFLPHMSGSTCPVVDACSMGAFAGLRNIATQGHLLRAMIEGLNYQFRLIVGGLESALGLRPDRYVAIGGVTQNRLWMQNKADVVGRPVEVPELDEAVPLGAAILAGIGVGLYRDERDAFSRVHRPGRVYEPNAALRGLYDERYDVFTRLYPALKTVCRA
jgi:xylulokinase